MSWHSHPYHELNPNGAEVLSLKTANEKLRAAITEALRLLGVDESSAYGRKLAEQHLRGALKGE